MNDIVTNNGIIFTAFICYSVFKINTSRHFASLTDVIGKQFQSFPITLVFPVYVLDNCLYFFRCRRKTIRNISFLKVK